MKVKAVRGWKHSMLTHLIEKFILAWRVKAGSYCAVTTSVLSITVQTLCLGKVQFDLTFIYFDHTTEFSVRFFRW